MKNLKPFPININITESGCNVKNRIKKNFTRWVNYSTKRSTKKHKDLTTYANECLEKKLFASLLKLHYDFTLSKMSVTRIKHDIIMRCKIEHFTGSFENRLFEAIKTDILNKLKSGQIRNSDKQILNIK